MGKSWASQRYSLADEPAKHMYGDFDFIMTDWKMWIKPEDTLRQFITETQYHSEKHAPAWGKAIMRPERIAIGWIHMPTNCFGRDCLFAPTNIKEQFWYAHVRQEYSQFENRAIQMPGQKNKTVE